MQSQDKGDVGVANAEEDTDLEFYRIMLEEEVEAGDVIVVFIGYTAPMYQDNTGLYYSRYYLGDQLT